MRLELWILANEPILVHLRDVEVPGRLSRQAERLQIYLELVVCGVLQALDCGAVLVLADTLLDFLVQQQVLVMGKPGTHHSDKRSQGALFPPLGRNVAPVGTGHRGILKVWSTKLNQLRSRYASA